MDNNSEKISVSRIIRRPDKARVVRTESNLPIFSKMLRSSALNFLDRDFKKHNNLDSDVEIAYKIAGNILELLQEDTHAEFAYKSVATIHGGKSYDLVLEPFKDISKLAVITNPRDILFLLMSNCFNRADELAETALKGTASKAVGRELGLNFLEKARIAEYKDGNGELIRINFIGAIKNIQTLARFWGIDGSSWDEPSQLIVESQLQGMDIIRSLKVEGRKYSTREAIDYRQNTVGKYSQLLGEIAFGKDDPKVKSLYTVMMLAQFHDGCFDVLEDSNSQVTQ